MSTWDKRLDFDEWRKKLEKELKELRKEKEYWQMKAKPMPQKYGRQLAYNSILLTQLLNGSRISEAVEACITFLKTEDREQKINTRKRKKRSKNKETGEIKTMGHDTKVVIIIPNTIKKHYLEYIKNKTIEEITDAVILFAINHHKINTHSLRYAWIAKMGELGKPANLISKAIRHTNIQTIEKYTREAQADDMKRDFVKCI